MDHENDSIHRGTMVIVTDEEGEEDAQKGNAPALSAVKIDTIFQSILIRLIR